MKSRSGFPGHICFIAGTLGQGGAEKQLYYMLSILKRATVKLTVLCLTRGEYWEAAIRALDIPVIYVGYASNRFLRLVAVMRHVRRFKPDVIQSAHFYTNLYAAIAGRVFGIPSIGALRNDCISEVASLGGLLGRLSLKLPTIVAANSQRAIENAKLLGADESRLYFLPNAIVVPEVPYPKRNGQGAITLLSVGRLVEQKRVDRFIRLIARLHCDRKLRVRGVIVGAGAKLDILQKYAKELGLTEDTITFRGAVADMANTYAMADIFVLTSDWEGTPNVILEAMAHGLPVLAAKVGGVPALIRNDENGVLIERDDEDEFVNQVYRLGEDQALRVAMGERARAFVVSRHSAEALEKSLISLYARLMRRLV